MKKAEAISILATSVRPREAKDRARYDEAVRMAIEALKRSETPNSSDCISRQAAIDIVMFECGEWIGLAREISKQLKQLPSVTPQRPKGKWIEVDVHNFYATLKCSVCDRVIKPYFSFGEYSYEDIKTFYPYCHCGAKMEVEE